MLENSFHSVTSSKYQIILSPHTTHGYLFLKNQVIIQITCYQQAHAIMAYSAFFFQILISEKHHRNLKKIKVSILLSIAKTPCGRYFIRMKYWLIICNLYFQSLLKNVKRSNNMSIAILSLNVVLLTNLILFKKELFLFIV